MAMQFTLPQNQVPTIILQSWNTLHIDQNSKTLFLHPLPLLYCDYNWVQQNHIPELVYSGEGSCRSIHHHLQAFPTNSTSKRRVEFGGIRHDPANLCPQLFLRLKETHLCKKTKILCSKLWTLTTHINLSQPPLTLCESLQETWAQSLFIIYPIYSQLLSHHMPVVVEFAMFACHLLARLPPFTNHISIEQKEFFYLQQSKWSCLDEHKQETSKHWGNALHQPPKNCLDPIHVQTHTSTKRNFDLQAKKHSWF
jgi:hypothetical protein